MPTVAPRAIAAAFACALTACSSTDGDRPAGTVIGSTLGVPVVANEPPPQHSVRAGPQGGLFGSPPPFGQPRGPGPSAAASPTYERQRITERTSVDGDGTVRTTRTTTTVGFNPDRAAASIGALAGLMVNSASGGGLPGVWRMQSSSTGSICSIYLQGGPADAAGPASVIDCGPTSLVAGLFAWRYEGGRLTLQMRDGGALAFSQQGPNRFDGSATWGFITTRLALYR